jgi:hypothetical protein
MPSQRRGRKNEGLLDTRPAFKLVMRDAGGEKALKELFFLKEQDEKIIEELSKLNPMIA